MKAFIATGWNFMRILRLIIGAAVTVVAVRNSDLLLGLGGGLLVLMAVFNAGCCGTGSCSISPGHQKQKTSAKETDSLSYKEVD